MAWRYQQKTYGSFYRPSLTLDGQTKKVGTKVGELSFRLTCRVYSKTYALSTGSCGTLHTYGDIYLLPTRMLYHIPRTAQTVPCLTHINNATSQA